VYLKEQMMQYSMKVEELRSKMGRVWEDLKAGPMEGLGRSFD